MSKTVIGGSVDGLFAVVLRIITIATDVIYNLSVNQNVITRYVEVEGQDLTDNEINAAQVLAHRKFPQFGGNQDTVLGINVLFKQASKDRPTMQILHTGMSHSNTQCTHHIGCTSY